MSRILVSAMILTFVLGIYALSNSGIKVRIETCSDGRIQAICEVKP